MANDAQPPAVPLCIDLDGTLLRSDSLHESALELLKRSPFALLQMPVWLAGGKARLKDEIAQRTMLDPAQLPYNQEVVDFIRQARAEGRQTILATGASIRIARQVSDHLGLFDTVIASDADCNLTARNKADHLVQQFGEGGFDYVGNETADIPVWSKARRAIVVGNDASLVRRARRVCPHVTHLADRGGGVALALIKALRPHQWLKNLLLLVPLLAGQKLGDTALLVQALLGLVAFSLAASSVYLINDLSDLQSDRVHLTKRNRSLASGRLPLALGLLIAVLLLLASSALALAFLPSAFAGILGLYLATTFAYTFWLKKQVMVDVLVLAGLYTLRVIAGSAATGIASSFWLLAFSMFVFLCLAIVKRYSELQLMNESAGSVAGRGYLRSDLPVLLSLGVASGMSSVLVLALYIDSPSIASAYPQHQWLWAMPPSMLYWTARLWMKTHRGEIHEDPVLFAIKDRQSHAILAIMAISAVSASLGLSF